MQKKKKTAASAPAVSPAEANKTKEEQEHEQNMARATSKGLAFSGQIQKGDYHHKYKDVHVALGSGMSGTVVKVCCVYPKHGLPRLWSNFASHRSS